LGISVFTTAIESLVDVLALSSAVVQVVATIDSANGLVNESAVARLGTSINSGESSLGTSHNAFVFIADSIGSADDILFKGALAF
jgi:hypothetical protein